MPAKPVHLGLVSGAIAFVVYLLTLAPDLTWANNSVDGGELITAAYTLGVPHPPGYPIYVLLGKLISILPVGTVAYRFNLLSAGSVALAAAFVTAASFHRLPFEPGESLTNSAVCALSAGLAFAFAPLIWGQAIVAEVYGLNLALLAFLLWSLLGQKPAWLSGLYLGLAITTHLTSLLMLPLALVLVPWQKWRELLLGVVLGLVPLLILPLLARSNSPVVWGDPTTLKGWWWLVSGRLYHANLFAATWPTPILRFREWGRLLLDQFTWAGPLLLFMGIKTGLKSHPRPNLALLVTASIYVIYAFGYGTTDAISQLLPALLLSVLLLALALSKMGRLSLLLPLILLLLNFNRLDLSDDMEVPQRVRQVFEFAPQQAILASPGDATIFALWYYQHVVGERTDLILVDENLFAFDWYRQRLQQLQPKLEGLARDDLKTFYLLNAQKRPYCHVSIISPEIDISALKECAGGAS